VGAEVIAQAVRLYLRFALSYRDVEELLAERGIAVFYETIRAWVAKFGAQYAGTTPANSGGAKYVAAGRGSSTRWRRGSVAGCTGCGGRSTSTGRPSTCSCRRTGTRRPWRASSAASWP
jgi:hypothetical protein